MEAGVVNGRIVTTRPMGWPECGPCGGLDKGGLGVNLGSDDWGDIPWWAWAALGLGAYWLVKGRRRGGK